MSKRVWVLTKGNMTAFANRWLTINDILLLGELGWSVELIKQAG